MVEIPRVAIVRDEDMGFTTQAPTEHGLLLGGTTSPRQ